MRRMCERLKLYVASLAMDDISEETLPAEFREHLDSCLTCRAEVAQLAELYKLHRSMTDPQQSDTKALARKILTDLPEQDVAEEDLQGDQYLVLNFCGNDGPGILARVCDFVYERNANVEECYSHSMGSAFSLSLLIGGDRLDIRELKNQLSSLKESLAGNGQREAVQGGEAWWNLSEASDRPLLSSILCRRATHPEQSDSMMLPTRWHFRIIAPDGPGLLASTAKRLAAFGVNIINYRGETFIPRRSGGLKAFTQDLTVRMPALINKDALVEEFEELASEREFLKWELEPELV